MKGQEDVFKQFHESFLKMDGHFHILEQRVPVELQMEYFKFSSRVRDEVRAMSDDDYNKYVTGLHSGDATNGEKKRILSILASSKQVRAYRLLERYVQQPDEELVDWAYMALMESRITLESELSDEKQIYISTGLGGKGDKLRFYLLILSSKNLSLLDYQKEVVRKEFSYVLPKENCEIERLNIDDKYVELVFLVPIKADLKRIMEDLIRECNVYGDFLNKAFTVTNVKELDREEINQIIEKYGVSQAGR